MDSAELLSAEERRDIVALAGYLERHIQAGWLAVLDAKRAKLLDAYERIGEMAYGAYMEFLIRPLRRQMKRAGLRLDQHFPGWREATVVERRLPNVRVTGARQTPANRANRVPLRSATAENLYFANDARDIDRNLSQISLAAAMEITDILARTPSPTKEAINV